MCALLSLRRCAHELVNRFQEVLGFLETGEYSRATRAMKKAIPLALQLQQLILTLQELDDEKKDEKKS